MTERWKKERRKGNNGHALDVYCKGDYEICLNVNRGLEVKTGEEDRHGHHWWFEVIHVSVGKESFVGQTPTLTGAKKLAAQHARK